MKKGIHFIITGGTIDSVYDGSKDTVVPSGSSILPDVMKLIKSELPLEFTEICMKDSRNLTAEDLGAVLDAVQKSEFSKIIITHGTYTMPDSARFLKAHLGGDIDKTIILTGSVIPIKGFSPSDGTFNIGYAVGQIEHLTPGVYVAMNARIFSPEEVIKRMSTATFESILGEK
ncbi:MAG: asparaginase [Candidatus Pacebacteria bacterium]|nr:asparaginase [Candidatus Paceibacterota bacterium]